MIVLLLAPAANLPGYARKISVPIAQNTATPTPQPSPIHKQITPADLAKLRWIEGRLFTRIKDENERRLISDFLAQE